MNMPIYHAEASIKTEREREGQTYLWRWTIKVAHISCGCSDCRSVGCQRISIESGTTDALFHLAHSLIHLYLLLSSILFFSLSMFLFVQRIPSFAGEWSSTIVRYYYHRFRPVPCLLEFTRNHNNNTVMMIFEEQTNDDKTTNERQDGRIRYVTHTHIHTLKWRNGATKKILFVFLWVQYNDNDDDAVCCALWEQWHNTQTKRDKTNMDGLAGRQQLMCTYYFSHTLTQKHWRMPKNAYRCATWE